MSNSEPKPLGLFAASSLVTALTLGLGASAWTDPLFAELLDSNAITSEKEPPLYANFWWDGSDGGPLLEMTANSTLPITVTPTIHIRGKRPVPLQTITMDPLETHRVRLVDHFPQPEKAIWGTVTLEGETNGIAGWVTSGSARSGKTSESIFRRSVEANSVVIGHWWRESRSQRVWFVLQNVSDEDQSVQVELSNREGTTPGPLLKVGAQEAVRVSLRQLKQSLRSDWSSEVKDSSLRQERLDCSR